MMYLSNWINSAPVIFAIVIMALSILFFIKGKYLILSSILSAVNIPISVFFISIYQYPSNLVILITILLFISAFLVTFIRCHYIRIFAIDVAVIVSVAVGFAGAVLGVRYIMFDPLCDMVYRGNIPTSIIVGVISLVFSTMVAVIFTTFLYLSTDRVEERKINVYYKISYISFFILSLVQISLIFL